LHLAVWWKFTDVPEVLVASIIIALVMEAASTSGISVNINETPWHNNPEDSHLQYQFSLYYTNKIFFLRMDCHVEIIGYMTQIIT
jgi:hypothetical protein